MKSKALNRSLKLKIYKSVIRPVVTCAYETWGLMQKRRTVSMNIRREILRKVLEPVENNDGSLRIRRNHETNNLTHGTDIERFIKSRSVVWLGHTMRMKQHRISRKILEWRPVDRLSLIHI